jgi:hypothetical protein
MVKDQDASYEVTASSTPRTWTPSSDKRNSLQICERRKGKMDLRGQFFKTRISKAKEAGKIQAIQFAPEKVRQAMARVRTAFPEVYKVVYDRIGDWSYWAYYDKNDFAPAFNDGNRDLDTLLMDEALDAVKESHDLPVIYVAADA